MIFHARNSFSASHFSFGCIFEIGSGDKCPLSHKLLILKVCQLSGTAMLLVRATVYNSHEYELLLHG